MDQNGKVIKHKTPGRLPGDLYLPNLYLKVDCYSLDTLINDCANPLWRPFRSGDDYKSALRNEGLTACPGHPGLLKDSHFPANPVILPRLQLVQEEPSFFK